MPGDKHVDLTKLSKLVGGTKAAFAARDVAERLTASACGSIPLFFFNLELKLIVERVCWFMRKYYSTQHDWTDLSLSIGGLSDTGSAHGEHIATEVTGRMKSRPCRPIDFREELCTIIHRRRGEGLG